MNWYKTSQHGEWWIIDGQAIFADADTGEMGHEAVVLDRVRNEIANMLGMGGLYEYYDWDDIKQQLVRSNFQQTNEEDQLLLLQKWEAEDENELIEKALYNPDIFDELAKENNISQYLLDTADNATDPRDYGMKELGWKRMAGDNIQTQTLTRNDLYSISNGIGDAFGIDADNMIFNIEVMANNKVYFRVPVSVIDDLNPMALREYEHNYSYATFNLKKHIMAQDVNLPPSFKPIAGSCMLAAEILTEKLLNQNIKEFTIIEGYITFETVEWNDTHTWIEMFDGKIIDPTKNQWGIKDIIYLSEGRRKYSPEQYLSLCQQFPSDTDKYFE